MKKLQSNLVTTIILLLVLSLTSFYFINDRGKIVYVDSGRLMSNYKPMIDAKREFEKKQSVWNANIDSLTKDVQSAITKYQKTLTDGSGKEKSLSKELIGAKQKELMNYQNAIKQNAAKEEQTLTAGILNDVNSYLLQYGKKKGYKLILIAANGNIAYAEQNLDITDQVLSDLNSDYHPSLK